MLIEGLVGVVALIAAASLPTDALLRHQRRHRPARRSCQEQLDEVNAKYGRRPAARGRRRQRRQHLDLGEVEEKVGGESLRGRTGGAVTLAVGMSVIFDRRVRAGSASTGDWLLKYWYHFAIMFEALFILTTIDTGTRIARFLLQETAGQGLRAVRPDRLAAGRGPRDARSSRPAGAC